MSSPMVHLEGIEGQRSSGKCPGRNDRIVEKSLDTGMMSQDEKNYIKREITKECLYKKKENWN